MQEGSGEEHKAEPVDSSESQIALRKTGNMRKKRIIYLRKKRWR